MSRAASEERNAALLARLAREHPEIAAHLAEVGGRLAEKASRAEKFWREFHWGRKDEKDPRIVQAPVIVAGEPLVELGALSMVGYVTRKGRERVETEYVHQFEGTLPTLAYSLDGRNLVVLGGTYKVEARGIVG